MTGGVLILNFLILGLAIYFALPRTKVINLVQAGDEGNNLPPGVLARLTAKRRVCYVFSSERVYDFLGTHWYELPEGALVDSEALAQKLFMLYNTARVNKGLGIVLSMPEPPSMVVDDTREEDGSTEILTPFEDEPEKVVAKGKGPEAKKA